MKASRQFASASIHHCRWLPCPAAAVPSEDGGPDCTDSPVVLAGWSEDAKQHIVAVVDIRQQQGAHELLPGNCVNPRLSAEHHGRVTDLQVARIQDFLLAATSSSTGSLSMLLMQLPPIPGATTADLVFSVVEGSSDANGGSGGASVLRELPALHQGPAASVDINSLQQRLLSVCGDGSIAIVRLDELDSAGVGADTFAFRPASGWGGYSQGRWVDSHVFATTGVLGGLQLWDERQGPAGPVSRSPVSWGHTGCAALDGELGVARQLLCLDVHPSRPNLAATGGSGGAVAVWDLRFQAAPLSHTGSKAAAGDVWQCKFDTGELLLSSAAAAVPPLLFSTSDAALCCAQGGPSGSGGGRGGGGLYCRVLQREMYGLCSFDIEPEAGQDILGATGDEHLLLLHRGGDL